MAIVNSLFNCFNTKRLRQIDCFRNQPGNVQNDMFKYLIAKAKDTQFGAEHRFGTIKNVEQFQQRVPIVEYEEFSPYIERLRKGEQNLLWPSEIKWFARSSGTTQSKSKFIPVSPEGLEDCHYRGTRDNLAIYNNLYPDNKLFTGKGLTLGGSHQVDNFSMNSYYGDLSAILLENQPWWVEFVRTPCQKVALLADWEEKLNQITNQTLKENVTSLSGVPSWNLVMIKHILNFTGKKNLLEVWPNLELFMHGGVNFAPYRQQYYELIPSDTMHYQESYNASEGFFAIQDDPQSDDMLLMLDYGVFYEFVPVEQLQNAQQHATTIENVEIGKNYAMVISTNSGLWRYLIGDTITFTSTFPHKIKITGRTRHYINAFGEELIIDNAERGLQIACQQTNAVVAEYTAAPVFMSQNTKGAHQWLVEFERPPRSLEQFAEALDKALCSLNSDYEAKRHKNITLQRLQLHSLQKGTFFKWMRQRGKLGGQNKVPRLSNTRQYVEQLLQIEQESHNEKNTENKI